MDFPFKLSEKVTDGLKLYRLNLEIRDNKEIMIDAKCSILHYSENIIVVNTEKFPIKITGDKLRIKHLGIEEVVIHGEMLSVEFLKSEARGESK